MPDEQDEELYLPDRVVDETEDNISPAVRELMAKYVTFKSIIEHTPLNLNTGSITPSQIMNGSTLRNRHVPKFTMHPVPIPS